jgi:hypothetical protein
VRGLAAVESRESETEYDGNREHLTSWPPHRCTRQNQGQYCAENDEWGALDVDAGDRLRPLRMGLGPFVRFAPAFLVSLGSFVGVGLCDAGI